MNRNYELYLFGLISATAENDKCITNIYSSPLKHLIRLHLPPLMILRSIFDEKGVVYKST